MEDRLYGSAPESEGLKKDTPQAASRRGSFLAATVEHAEAPKAVPQDSKFDRVLAELLQNKPELPKAATESVISATVATPSAETSPLIAPETTAGEITDETKPDEGKASESSPAADSERRVDGHVPEGFDVDYGSQHIETAQPPHTVYGGESLHEVDLHSRVEETVDLRAGLRSTTQGETTRVASPDGASAPAEALIIPHAEQAVAPAESPKPEAAYSVPASEQFPQHVYSAGELPAEAPKEPVKHLSRAERPIPTTTLMERFRSAQSEKSFAARLEKLLPKRGEKQSAAKAEQLHVPEEHRLEASAWHSIEIDAKTGRPVENGTFEYGHEYYQERAHEITPRINKRDAAAGEVALVAAAMPSSDDNVTQPDATDATPAPADANDQQEHSLKAKATDTARKTLQASGPIWPFVVAFAAVVVLLILAFR